MTKTIHLDRRRTAPYEPSEGDEYNGSWISSFDVPKVVRVSGLAESIRTVGFDYIGGETGDQRRPLDDEDSTSIQIRIGRHTGKILEMNFDPPVSPVDFPAIAGRIASQGEASQALATRFNFVMIAGIFRHWSEVISED